MTLQGKVAADWLPHLEPELGKNYMKELRSFLKSEDETGEYFPAHSQVFHALDTTSLADCKVVILGQDPYHGAGQAMGLSFSVPMGVKPPPSLKRVFKELNSDMGCDIPAHGDLHAWANQGVLLLNSVLTVRSGQPGSHAKHGWETFTDCVIETINREKSGVVFLLWGNYAKKKGAFIDSDRHHVLQAAHPSPLATTGFLGCGHFSKTNNLLEAEGLEPIDWQLF